MLISTINTYLTSYIIVLGVVEYQQNGLPKASFKGTTSIRFKSHEQKYEFSIN